MVERPLPDTPPFQFPVNTVKVVYEVSTGAEFDCPGHALLCYGLEYFQNITALD